MPIRKIIKKTIKTIGRKKRGRPTDEDRRYEAISEDVEDYSRSRKADIEQKRKLRKKAAGGIIKKGIKAISKKKKGRPKSKEGPTKKVFVNKPITPTNQQSLLKQYKTVKDSFDKQQGIMKSIRERGDKPITDGQRKSTESFIRTMIFGSPAKGPTIVRITKDSIRKAYKKGNERLRFIWRLGIGSSRSFSEFSGQYDLREKRTWFISKSRGGRYNLVIKILLVPKFKA